MDKKIILTRKLQKRIFYIQEKCIFIFSHMSLGSKLALFSLLVCFTSLFLPWFSLAQDSAGFTNTQANAFASVLGNIGFFYLGLIAFNAFHLLSIKKKKQLRNVSGFSISNTHISLLASIIISISCIHIYLLIRGLGFFSSEVSHKEGLILCMTGAILLGISVYFLKKEEKKNLSGSYIQALGNTINTEKNTETNANMKLPV